MRGLGRHVPVEERRGGPQDRGAVLRQETGRGDGVERGAEQRRETGPQLRRHHGDAADVREREHYWVDVGAGHAQVVEERAGAGRDGAVRVPDALGRRGGARRVVDPGDAGRVMVRRRRGGGTLGERELARIRRGREVADDDPRRGSREEPPGHCLVVESPPPRGHDDQVWADLADDHPHLCVAQDRQDRVLHRAEPGQRGHQHHRLGARGQLPADHRAGADALVAQRPGDPFGAFRVLGEGQRPAEIVAEHHRVRGRRRPAGDQPPPRRDLVSHLASRAKKRLPIKLIKACNAYNGAVVACAQGIRPQALARRPSACEV